MPSDPPDICRVILTGGVTSEPTLRHTRDDVPVTNLRIAYRTRHNVNGAARTQRNFVDVVIYGSQAELAVEVLSVGKQIAVDGQLTWREWNDDSGARRQAQRVEADYVRFLPGPNGRAG